MQPQRRPPRRINSDAKTDAEKINFVFELNSKIPFLSLLSVSSVISVPTLLNQKHWQREHRGHRANPIKRIFFSASVSASEFIRRGGRLCGCILFLFSFATLSACEHANSSTVSMRIGDQSFELELALTEAQQELGLMHRDHLDSDKGMLFIFPDMQVRTFWNHDVSFPLDLVFLDSSGKIVSIKQMQKFNDLNVSSDVPAKYAIELNEGTAANVGIKIGDSLSIPAVTIVSTGQ